MILKDGQDYEKKRMKLFGSKLDFTSARYSVDSYSVWEDFLLQRISVLQKPNCTKPCSILTKVASSILAINSFFLCAPQLLLHFKLSFVS